MPNSRIRPATDPWVDILPTELETLEANLAAGINGDDGSTHAPATPIGIHGSQGLRVTGPAVIERGGSINATVPQFALSGRTLNLQDGDWPLLDPSNALATRTPMQSVLKARGYPWDAAWIARQENGSLQALAPSIDLDNGQGPQTCRAYVPLDTHDGATLTQIVVYFHVGALHAGLPSVMPSVRVLRQDASGNTVALTSAAAGADVNGYVYVPKPASGAAWTNNFATQSLTVPCDQNNVIDESQYTYIVELVEEQGLTGYPWQLLLVQVLAATTQSLTGMPSPTPNLPIMDGIDLSHGGVGQGGDRILVKNQSPPTMNGVYVDGVSGWTIDPTFQQGMVVYVSAGVSQGGQYFQAKSTIASWSPAPSGPTPPGYVWLEFFPEAIAPFPPEGTALFAHGISWHAIQPTYSQIPDLRPG